MPEIMVDAQRLLVDPTRFSPREDLADEAYLATLEAALAEGETLPPLRVAAPADPYLEWWGCPRAHTQRQQAEWAASARQLPYTQRPLRAEYVVIDGVARFWALVRAHEAAGGRARLQVAVVVDAEPVATPAEVLLRALDANLRNARSLSEPDLRTSFARLWLGRRVKDKYERWTTEPGALSIEDIAARLHRSLSWASRMQTWVQVTQRLDGLDLGPYRAEVLGRLPEDLQPEFAFLSDGSYRPHHVIRGGAPTGAVKAIDDLTRTELGELVDLWLAGRPAEPASAETPSFGLEGPADEVDEEAAADGEQLALDLGEVDLVEPARLVRTWAVAARRATPEALQPYYRHLLVLRSEVQTACDVAEKRLRAAGLL